MLAVYEQTGLDSYEEVPAAVFEGGLVAALPERIALLPTGV